jgi:hypothetical protein
MIRLSWRNRYALYWLKFYATYNATYGLKIENNPTLSIVEA